MFLNIRSVTCQKHPNAKCVLRPINPYCYNAPNPNKLLWCTPEIKNWTGKIQNGKVDFADCVEPNQSCSKDSDLGYPHCDERNVVIGGKPPGMISTQ